MIQVTPVVLCGGAGTRLWPLSRSGFPKQFLSLTGKESLFQQAVMRFQRFDSSEIGLMPPLIVAGDEHRFLLLEQLREVGITQTTAILEPVGRNTAPALTLAALSVEASGQDPVLVVTPADHHMPDVDVFIQTMQQAVLQASLGHIVVLGVEPDRPDTGFGYIQVANSDQGVVRDVLSFVEKPSLDKAKIYIEQGDYLWNAGMFVLKASVWLAALKTFRPDMDNAVRAAWEDRSVDEMSSGRFVRPDKEKFENVPSDSIDYAVMECCPGSNFTVKVVGFNGAWSDLGAWDAVWDSLPRDEHGNAAQGDVLQVNSQNNLTYSSGRLVSLVGVHDLVVVETPDAVLVSARDASQNVKCIVQYLQVKDRKEATLHRKVHRPWGWYDSIEEGDRFKVKLIHVKPGCSLSLQKHHHRAEHWIVVRGTARITNGDQVELLTENQSTYIPIGQVHRLTNPGNIELEIVEVQSGSYLGEDDIVRFEDDYGRGTE